MKLVIGLEHTTREDIDLAGGKGANLGELIQQSFPVPPGFVVTAQAYESIVNGWPLSDLSPDEIRSRIHSEPLPTAITDAIQQHHYQLAPRFTREFVYAVRSSATAEDLSDASFAGQHDTYYYVNQNNLAHMVKKCWASLWSEAACSYRDSQGIAHHLVSMAVVVQVMIESDISGITFTANPVSGNRDEIVMEASWGMGAAIVDGRVSLDQYIFDRTQQDLSSKRIADKKFMVSASVIDGESRLEPVPEIKRRQETLDQSQLQTIIDWAEKSEQYFDTPQDLEWNFERGEFYTLQSRPITTLTVKEDLIPEGKFVLFKPMAENFTVPLLPLSQNIFLKLFPILTMIRGRAYLNIKHIRPLFPFKISDEQIAELAYLSDSKSFKPKLSVLRLIGLGVILYLNYLVMGVINYRTDNLPDDFMTSFRALFRKTVADDKIDAPGLKEKLFFRPRFFEPVGNLVIWVNLTAPRCIVLLGVLTRLLKY